MELKEGQIYEGHVSLSGAEGPMRRWIVVAPFNKTHIHSIDNPIELHCWPTSVIHQGIRTGRLKLLDTDPGHPVVRLQRAKEAFGIKDTHLGLRGESLNKMLGLLGVAVAMGEDYAPYIAGEILALIKSAPHTRARLESVKTQVYQHLQEWDYRPAVA